MALENKQPGMIHSERSRAVLLTTATVSLLASVIKTAMKGEAKQACTLALTVTQNTLDKHPPLMRHTAYSEYITLAKSFY